MTHARVPKLVKGRMHKYFSHTCLVAVDQMCTLASDESSPFYAEFQRVIPENEPGEREERTRAIREIRRMISTPLSKGGQPGNKHTSLPGFVPLENFVTKMLLEEFHRLCYLATDPDSVFYTALEAIVPPEIEGGVTEWRKALHEIGVIVMEARKRCGGG